MIRFFSLFLFVLNTCQPQVVIDTPRTNVIQMKTFDMIDPLQNNIEVSGIDGSFGNSKTINIALKENNIVIDSLTFSPFGKFIVEYGVFNFNIFKIVMRNWAGCESEEITHLIGIQNRRLKFLASFYSSYHSTCFDTPNLHYEEKTIIDFYALSPHIKEYSGSYCTLTQKEHNSCEGKMDNLSQNRISLQLDNEETYFYNKKYILDGNYRIGFFAKKPLLFEKMELPALVLTRHIYVLYNNVWYELDEKNHIMHPLYE